VNLIVLEPAEVGADGSAVLRDHRARHICAVHRAAPGDVLRAGVIGGRIGTGTVRSVSEGEVVLDVVLTDDPPPRSGIDVIMALPRPKVLRRILAMSATLGVGRVVVVNARAVEPSYFDSPALAPDAIRAELVLGLEQARDTRLPEVLVRRLFRPFVEDEVAQLWPDSIGRFVPDPTARQSIRAVTPSEHCVIAIGPEGGWIPFEINFLRDHGFEPISLGPRILRVESALPFVIGQILAQR
jgi:RsmE family RNA methyltransferase